MLLEVKNLSVRYGTAEAVRGVSFCAESGTIVTLIGANGAGKSTCLKAISGLVRAASGEIWFDGKRIDGMAPEKIAKLGIAHVPEGKRLFLRLSVYKNLMVGAYSRKKGADVNRDLERAYQCFPILRERRKQRSANLSGGQQQMLACGRGMLSNPKLFIFDEPSLGLAPIVVMEVAEHIRQLAGEGATIILVEQNATLALKLAQRAYVLESGIITLEGDAKELQANDHVRTAYLGL